MFVPTCEAERGRQDTCRGAVPTAGAEEYGWVPIIIIMRIDSSLFPQLDITRKVHYEIKKAKWAPAELTKQRKEHQIGLMQENCMIFYD